MLTYALLSLRDLHQNVAIMIIMCGRYVRKTPIAELAARYGISHIACELEPSYNVTPTQPVAAIVYNRRIEAQQLVTLRWGLVPAWAKDPSGAAKMINARSESLTEKPSFREAFRQRRCLILADGFYEWRTDDKAKQPFYIHKANGEPLVLAGLYEHWRTPDRTWLSTCTIITTHANAQLTALHHRMPVILDPEQQAVWLNPDLQQPDQLQPLLQPYAEGAMAYYPVDKRVNSNRYDAPEAILPLETSEASVKPATLE
jgi:putative SOS response-associated peptidase YedK